MKNSLKLLALAALASLAATAQAQVKVSVVDMAKVFDSHYKTADYGAKLQADEQKAQEEVEKMSKDLNATIEEFKKAQEEVNSPMLNKDAKAKAEDKAKQIYANGQKKEQEIQQFIGQTRQSIQQRVQNFRGVLIEEISKVATEIAKRRGANLLLDKGSTIFADASFDITEEVIKEVNKDRPASSAATPAPAPAAAGATPTITVPGAKK